MITLDKLNERIASEVVTLEDFLRSQTELLDAMKKVQVYFASRTGSVTPKQAEKLLLPAAETSTVITDWPGRIAAALERGPQKAGEIWQNLLADGTPKSKRGTFYQALAMYAKRGDLFHRTGDNGSAYKLVTHKATNGAGRVSWEEKITTVLADGKARTLQEIWDALDLKEKNSVICGRFSVAFRPLRLKGIVKRDENGLYWLASADRRSATPATWKKRANRRRDRSSEFAWKPAILRALQDGKPRDLQEIWDALMKQKHSAQMTRARFNTAMPRMRRVGQIVRDDQGRYTISKGEVLNERSTHNDGGRA
jgi:hypothetical protein